MNNPIQRPPEIRELKRGNDPDTVLSLIVLLLACLGLAVLAHVFV